MPNGRPMQARSLEIKDALEGKQAGDTVAFDLEPQEVEQFSRFSQRCRTVSRGLGMKVSVRTDREDKNKAYVVIKKTGLDPHAPAPKRGKRGRPRKEDLTQEEEMSSGEEAQAFEKDAPEEQGATTESYENSEDQDQSEGSDDTVSSRAAELEDAVAVERVETVVVSDSPAEETAEELLNKTLDKEANAPCVALCVTASVSAYKAPEIVRGLQKAGCDVAVAMTPTAEKFIGRSTFASLTDLPVAIDLFDWSVSQLPHIDLADWADLICVAPASADTLAKLAHGLADDCVCATVLAADSPVMVCPAMNVRMWKNPATQANVATLQERGIIVLEPTKGYLVCGDWGEGKLAPVDGIVRACLDELNSDD